MSQLPPSSPPPPYGSMQRPPGYPPPGYPPPPGPGYGQVQPQPKTSAAAVASLVLGLLGCVPFVTSLLAVIFGLVGFAAAGKPLTKGRGFAVVGLLLGLLGLAVWAGAVAGGFNSHANAAADEATAKQFVLNLAGGRAGQAVASCDPASVSSDAVEKLGAQLAPLGAPVDVRPVGFSYTVFGHQMNASDPTGNAAEVIAVVKYPAGVVRQIWFHFAPAKAGGNDVIKGWDPPK